MELYIRFIAFLFTALGFVLQPIYLLIGLFKKEKVSPITDRLLLLSCKELAQKIRNQEVRSEEVVRAYIDRINTVNKLINAVIEDRFKDALKDARRADHLCKQSNIADIEVKYPLLGVPFTVKESCRVKGLSLQIGMLDRAGMKSPSDSEAVANLRAAGAIPLLVSATPEFCFGWECRSMAHGVSNNPYDIRRTPGGTSGGEAALNAAGASVFGVGSDMAGSLRGPSLFCGVFGHKPTGGLIPSVGHYPNASDKNFDCYLQMGPLTRFAADLPILLGIMAGESARKLELEIPVELKNIKIYYKYENEKYNGWTSRLSPEIQQPILDAVDFFKEQKFDVKNLSEVNTCPDFDDIFEMSLSSFFQMENIPNMLKDPDNPEIKDNVIIEFLKYLIGRPKHSFLSLTCMSIIEFSGYMTEKTRRKYAEKLPKFKFDLERTIGKNGVLLFPTANCVALRHTKTLMNFTTIMFTMIFNVLGFPATHVPMGLNKEGLPLGFQVVAAPYNDKLCFAIAKELSDRFGGWVQAPE